MSRVAGVPLRLVLLLALLFACLVAARLAWAAATGPYDGGSPPGIEVANAAQNDEDLFDCSDFESQEDSQAQLLEGDPYGLDEDGDGVACNEDGVQLAAEVASREESAQTGVPAGGDTRSSDPSSQSQDEEQYREDSQYLPESQTQDQYSSENQYGSTRSTAGVSQYESVLLEAGGPSDGPVPPMPDGECPTEYPSERDGGCHKAR